MKIEVNSPTHGTQTILIDDQDINLFDPKKLYIHKVGHFYYVRVNPTKIGLHRLIMKSPKGLVIHHINRNPLDNRRSNLRIATIQENLRNQIRPNNKTGKTGVSIQKYKYTKEGKTIHKKAYTAQIKINYKKIHLGFFKNLDDAIKTREEAEIKHFGAKVNSI